MDIQVPKKSIEGWMDVACMERKLALRRVCVYLLHTVIFSDAVFEKKYIFFSRKRTSQRVNDNGYESV